VSSSWKSTRLRMDVPGKAKASKPASRNSGCNRWAMSERPSTPLALSMATSSAVKRSNAAFIGTSKFALAWAAFCPRQAVSDLTAAFRVSSKPIRHSRIRFGAKMMETHVKTLTKTILGAAMLAGTVMAASAPASAQPGYGYGGDGVYGRYNDNGPRYDRRY